MDDWLRDMQLFRQELVHYKRGVSDEEFAEIILRNVVQTHRDVVRQFSRYYDPGYKTATPLAAQVMNALRAESELDARSEDPQSNNISSAQAGKKQGKQQGQQPGKAKMRSRGRFKAKGNQVRNNGGTGGTHGEKKNLKEDTRGCWNCHETGHIQAKCPRPKRNDDKTESQLPERKRWQSKGNSGASGGRNGGNQRTIDMISRDDSDLETVAMQNSIITKLEWVLDSASDRHVCLHEDLLSNVRQDDGPLVFDWEGKPSRNRGVVGEVEIRVKNEDQPDAATSLCLLNVLHTPSGTNNLLSLDKLEQAGWEFVKPGNHTCAWLRKGGQLLKLVKTRGRYRLQSLTRQNDQALVRWHARLGHLNFGALQEMSRNETVKGMDLVGSCCVPSDRCWTCEQSRMKQMSYKKVRTARSKRPYQKLMSDMCYVNELTYDGFKHFQVVQDEAMRYVWGFLLKRKDQSDDAVIKHIAWLLAQGHRIEVIGSDKGRELLNNNLKTFLRAHGIEWTLTNAYSPEENGLVKHMNGVVMSRVRSLLTLVDMPILLWGEAFIFALEVLNISPSSALAGETPYTRHFGERPELSNLRTWGCLAFAFTQKELRKSKLENPGKPCIFLVYAKNSICWACVRAIFKSSGRWSLQITGQ
ncbi:hypothetical protein PF007_g3367 [Phytophthora fragariae]|uniref:Integrase catalytic domain-containing protein n=1 Tax=Phytophthora fragariae TaxID=53985 RepID=A0A6A3F4E3_9STRA|nr:hypothetical protein PF009_g10887 [Phytophthora fragariae]KAE9133414.1 hypothetical protein PF007_g3367 [Phytophthora fragariae]